MSASINTSHGIVSVMAPCGSTYVGDGDVLTMARHGNASASVRGAWQSARIVQTRQRVGD